MGRVAELGSLTATDSMRLRRSTGWRDTRGFYEFHLSLLGAVLLIATGIVVPALLHLHQRGWATAAVVVGLFGVALGVYDQIEYRRLMREPKRKSKDSPNDKPKV